jgi:ABC-2 type transport system ATP-binding protein
MDSCCALQVSGLTKHYGPSTGSGQGLLAVDHIDFEVHRGEIFGFLGPNGAGKTTTIRMLTGLTRPTAGQAHVLGLDLYRDLPRIKKQIGVVPETSNLYNELTALDNLIFMEQLYGVPRHERRSSAEELLRRFRLGDRADIPFARLSRGMKRALTIAAALVHRPQLLFLDEPTVGLDVVNARSVRALIEGLREQGVTIFLTTHYLEEADRLCDRVALIVQGRIVALDTVSGLKARVQRGATVEVRLSSPFGEESKRFHGEDAEAALNAALTHARFQAKRVLAVNTLQPTLEDAFIELTGLSTEVMQAEKGGGW